MDDKKTLEGLQGSLTSLKEQRREVQEDLEKLEEKEEELKDELETVRGHIKYYEDLIADMKKKMKGRNELSFFDHI